MVGGIGMQRGKAFPVCRALQLEDSVFRLFVAALHVLDFHLALHYLSKS